MKKKRIIISHRYIYPDKSHCSLILYNIAKHLNYDGYCVKIISSYPSYRKNSSKIKISKEKIKDLSVERINLANESTSMFKRIINSILLGLFLIKKSFFFKPDLIVVTSIPPILGGFFGILCKKIFKCKLIYFCMDIHPEIGLISNDYKNNILKKFFFLLDNYTCSKTDKIIVHSSDMKASLIDRGVQYKDKILIINNFAKQNNVSITKKKYTKLDGFLKIIYAGNIGRFQSLENILIAMKLINNKNIELNIVGEGSKKNELENFSKKNNLNVNFLGYLSQNKIADLIDISDICLVTLMPEIYKYAYPSKIMTYLSRGKPIIATVELDSEIANSIINEKYGYVVNQNDYNSLAKLLLKISHDGNLLKNLNHNSKKAFDKFFSEKVILNKWSSLIKDVI